MCMPYPFHGTRGGEGRETNLNQSREEYFPTCTNLYHDRCKRLGLYVFSFLWERDQDQLYDEMVESDIHAIFIKVAAMGNTTLSDM